MKWHNFLLFVIFITFFLKIPCSGQTRYVEMSYDHFRIKYLPKDENRAMAGLQILKENQPRFEKFYGIRIQRFYSIIFPGSLPEFRHLTGGRLPEWSGAVFMPRQRYIVIKNPEWAVSNLQLETNLTHEVSHLYFYEKFGKKSLPLWFNEGLAEFLSGEKLNIRRGTLLANALFSHTLIPLGDIDSLLAFRAGRANLAYIESLSAILFLQHNYISPGYEWQEFLNRVLASDFDTAIKDLTGMDMIDFELKWYRWVDKKYSWFILFNLENLVWVVMAVVLLGALYSLRYRNKKTLRRWELEETIEGYPDDSDWWHVVQDDADGEN